MAKRQLVLSPDELLRKKSREVTTFDARLHQLLDDMAETMYDADGVGLAASAGWRSAARSSDRLRGQAL